MAVRKDITLLDLYRKDKKKFDVDKVLNKYNEWIEHFNTITRAGLMPDSIKDPEKRKQYLQSIRLGGLDSKPRAACKAIIEHPDFFKYFGASEEECEAVGILETGGNPLNKYAFSEEKLDELLDIHCHTWKIKKKEDAVEEKPIETETVAETKTAEITTTEKMDAEGGWVTDDKVSLDNEILPDDFLNAQEFFSYQETSDELDTVQDVKQTFETDLDTSKNDTFSDTLVDAALAAGEPTAETVFRAGRLFEELSITYTSQTWSGKQWQRELHHYVDEMTGFGYRDWIIRKALEIAQDLIDKKKADMRSAKYATWHQFAGNFASSLQDLENNGLNAEEAEEIVLEAAETALRAVAPDVNGLKKNKTFSASDYLYVYKKEYIRCKEFSVPKETQDSSQKQKTQEEDVYVDDGRPVIEQYLLYQALKRPRTEVGFGQIPTGEAKSYTIEEIICKAIKGVPGYVELFDRYDRIIVTTIQNKLIASESLCTKHGAYNLTEEEYKENVLEIRGLLENLKRNFEKSKKLMPVDILNSEKLKELEDAYRAALNDAAAKSTGLLDADSVAESKIQLRVSEANRDLFSEAVENKGLEDMAVKKAKEKLKQEDTQKVWDDLDKLDQIARVQEEKVELICTSPNYEWMAILWPVLLVYHRKVIFTTVSKMVFPYKDLSKGRGYPYDRWMKKALLFSDEGDASKKYQIKPFIENQYAENYDLKLLLTSAFDQLKDALEGENSKNQKEKWAKWENRFDEIHSDGDDTLADNKLNTMKYLYKNLGRLISKYHLKRCFRLEKTHSLSRRETNWYVYAGGWSTNADASGKHGELVAFFNEKTNQVDVYKLFAKDKPITEAKEELRSRYGKEAEINLVRMTADMRRMAINFAKAVRILVEGYRWLDEEDTKKEIEDGYYGHLKMSERSAWHNVLIAVGMDDTNNTRSDYLMNQIPPVPIMDKEENGQERKLSNFAAYGWQVTVVVANEDTREDLRFSNFSVPITAERILGIEALRGKVFCLSGTMDIDSTITNYNRSELTGLLGSEHVQSLNEMPVWIKHFNDELLRKWQPYLSPNPQINIHTECIPIRYSSKEPEPDKDKETLYILKEQLKNYPQCAEKITEKINAVDKEQRSRLVIFAKLVDWFVAGDLSAMLHFEKKLPTEGNIYTNNDWTQSVLQFIFDEIVEAKCKSTGKKESIAIIFLRAKTFATNPMKGKGNLLQEIISQRENGQRQYIVTAYSTAGVGINLESQKPITVSDDQVVVLPFRNEDDARRKKMDIPALYLGPITNNAVPVSSNTNTVNDVIAHINDIMYMLHGGDIPPFVARKAIDSVIELYAGGNPAYKKEDFFRMDGYRKAAEKDVHQALGRIMRGGCKNKDIYIFANADVGKVININMLEEYTADGLPAEGKPTKGFVQKKVFMPPETEALYRMFYDKGIAIREDPQIYKYINKNMTNSGIYHSRIKSLVHREYGNINMRQEQMDEYEQVKEDVVTTFSSNDPKYATDSMYSVFKQPVNSYYYSKQGDFETCVISDDIEVVRSYMDNLNRNSSDKWNSQFGPILKVSEAIFEFPTLFDYPGIKEEFERRNMFTSCQPGRYVLNPEAANLARGRQGEVACQVILHKEKHMHLREITDGVRYERFDMELKDGIYIDFKNYHDGELPSRIVSELILHTQEKVKKIDAKKVYIINLIDKKVSQEVGEAISKWDLEKRRKEQQERPALIYDAQTSQSAQIVYINGLIDQNGHVIKSHLDQILQEDYDELPKETAAEECDGQLQN